MKVLLLSKAMTVPVTKSKADRLAQHCDLTLAVPNRWPGYLPEAITKGESYKTVQLPIFLAGHNHLHFYRGLGSLLRAVRPDLVHIDEEPYSLVTFQALWLSRRLGAKAVAFTWQNIYKRYPLPFSWMEGYVYKNIAHIIAGNQESLDVMRNKGYAGSSRVIPQFGIEPDRLGPALADKGRYGIAGDSLAVAYVGRLVPEKGVDLAIRALTRVEGVTLYLVGTGPARNGLAELASSLGLSGRVRFLGGMASTDVPGFMASVDVLVLPSRTRPNWKEQFGRVLIEAMASGTAVVGSDSGEIPRVIGDAGLVFPEEDWQALAASIAQLKNSQLRSSLTAKGLEWVRQFSQENIVRQTLEVYREVLAR